MIVTSMQLTISSRRDIAVLQKESSSLEGEEDVNYPTTLYAFLPGASLSAYQTTATMLLAMINDEMTLATGFPWNNR
jgi:hypothetical protein